MKVFSLRTVIDDILLIVRNNNISESEDLSRDQIRAWVLAYKAYLANKKVQPMIVMTVCLLPSVLLR